MSIKKILVDYKQIAVTLHKTVLFPPHFLARNPENEATEHKFYSKVFNILRLKNKLLPIESFRVFLIIFVI
jgi:hypothetical protein